MNKCLNCEKEAKKKFCSLSCSASFSNRSPKRTKSMFDSLDDNKLIEIYNTSKTKDEFYLKLGYLSRVNNKIREKVKIRLESLGIDFINLNYIGLISDRTKGELFEQRTNWQSARSGIQKDARNVYKKSDCKKECYICGYDKHYEVAHVKSVASFPDETLISDINHIDNLIALCPNHHWEYDRSLLEIKKP